MCKFAVIQRQLKISFWGNMQQTKLGTLGQNSFYHNSKYLGSRSKNTSEKSEIKQTKVCSLALCRQTHGHWRRIFQKGHLFILPSHSFSPMIPPLTVRLKGLYYSCFGSHETITCADNKITTQNKGKKQREQRDGNCRVLTHKLRKVMWEKKRENLALSLCVWSKHLFRKRWFKHY